MSIQASDSESVEYEAKLPEEQAEGSALGQKDAEVSSGQIGPVWINAAPDGGATAWLVVLGAWCTSFCSFGWINSIGIFQEYYQTGPLREYSASTIAWIPSLQVFFMMAMGPFVGTLFDKYGPRYLIIGGTFMHVFGLMMASISTQYYQFLLSQGVCSAIGVAAVFQPALSCIMGWFDKKRGIAYGVLSTGSSLGGVIFPIMVNHLISEVGYGWAMRISAFLILALLIIAIVTVKARRPHGRTPLTGDLMAKPFKDIPFLALAVGLGCMSFGIYIPVDFLPTEAIAVGSMSKYLAQYIIAIYNGASLFGRLGSGFTADKLGKYNVFIFCCYMSGIVTLTLWIAGNGQGATIAYAVLFGFFSGAYVSLIGGVVAQISAPREIGYRTGLVFLVASIPSLTSNPIAGAILAQTGSWVNVKVFSGVFILAGTTLVMGTRIAHAGWKLTAVF
ncbi:MFS general substrate transporter [Stipitochalara longipes BDJ]|nr:MFS general substrate transporter [Stipitochalara longipes BDJ]